MLKRISSFFKKIIPPALAVAIIAMLGVFSVQMVFAAVATFSQPAGGPSVDTNVAAPLNVGAVSQIKSGSLWVDTFGTNKGAYFVNGKVTVTTAGDVGIGTVSPGARLEVLGSIMATGGNVNADQLNSATLSVTNNANVGGTITGNSVAVSNLTTTASAISTCTLGAPGCVETTPPPTDPVNKYTCVASDVGKNYVDLYVSSGNQYKRTVTCSASGGSYSIRTTAGTLEFLNTSGAVKLRLGSDGSLCFGAIGSDCKSTWSGLGGGGASTFLGLTDTPSAYGSANAGKLVAVNSTGNALEFVTPTATVNWSGILNGGVNSGVFMTYKPDGTACTANQVLKYDAGGHWICADDLVGAGGGLTWTQGTVGTISGLYTTTATDKVWIGSGKPASADATSLSVTNGSTNAAIYAKQTNSSGYAGYFDGGKTVFMNGNVGIGNASPSNKLDVNGAVGFSNSNTPPSGAGIYQGLGYLQVRGGTAGFTVNNNANGRSNMVILDSGNVGIGANPPDTNYKITTSGGGIKAENNSATQPAIYANNSGTGPALQVGAGGLTLGGVNKTSWPSSGMTNPMTTSGDIIYGGTGGTPTRLAGSAGFLKSTGSGVLSFNILTATDIPSLDAAKITTGTLADARIASASTWNAKAPLASPIFTGNVGIGVTSPDTNYKITTSGGGIKAESTSQPAGYFNSTSGYGLIVNSGNVGIGTAAPGANYKLDVAGNINYTGAIYKNGAEMALSWEKETGSPNIFYRNGDVTVRPDPTKLGYEYTYSSTVSGSQTPRCGCDSNSGTNECSSPYIDAIDRGAACYDQYLVSGAPSSAKFNKTASNKITGGSVGVYNILTVGSEGNPSGYSPIINFNAPGASNYSMTDAGGSLKFVNETGVPQFLLGQDGYLNVGAGELIVSTAGVVTANKFIGDGSGLTGVPAASVAWANVATKPFTSIGTGLTVTTGVLSANAEADPTVKTFAKTVLPTCSAGQVLKGDGTDMTCVSTGGVTSVTATAPVVSSGGTAPIISMPAASASTNGYLTSANWSTFNSKLSSETDPMVKAITGLVKSNGTTISAAVAGTDYVKTEADPKVGTLTANYLPKWGATALANSSIFDNGTSVGIGTAAPGANYKLDVAGTIFGNNSSSYGTVGVYGVGGANGYGVRGDDNTGAGVYGTGQTGVSGSGSGYGVFGYGATYGVYGSSPATAVRGYSTGISGIGVDGQSGGASGIGVSGQGRLYGVSGASTGTGVRGWGSVGVAGYSNGGAGVQGIAQFGNDYAAQFIGMVQLRPSVLPTCDATHEGSLYFENHDLLFCGHIKNAFNQVVYQWVTLVNGQ